MATFKATLGKFIEGRVEPVVDGVRVTGSKEGVPQLEGNTNSQGRYKIGPVRDTAGYEVKLEKEGYEFEKNPKKPTDFKSIRLSQLRLNFRDEESGKPLTEVGHLVSSTDIGNLNTHSL